MRISLRQFVRGYQPLGDRLNFAAVAVLALALAGCHRFANHTAPKPNPPCPAPSVDFSGWPVVDLQYFSFRLPPGFRKVPTRGIDSYVGKFETDKGDAEIGFDFGWYSNDLNYAPEVFIHYERCTEGSEGRTATFVTGVVSNPRYRPQDGRQVAAATWRNLYNSPDSVDGHTHLTIWTETEDPSRLPALQAMLRTVRIRSR